MENNNYDEILEIFYRNQTKQSYNLPKHKFIKVTLGKKEIDFPIQHIQYFPRHLSESIFKHIGKVKKISFDFKEQNSLIFDFYSKHHYEEIFKYREETIQVWHAFNKDKLWRYNEPITGVDNCVKRLEEKWENGTDNYNQEISFIKNHFNKFVEKKEEKFIKQIPFELFNTILQRLPLDRKLEWITNIIPEGKEDIIKSRRVEAIGELDIDKLNDEEIKKVIKIINGDRSETKWIEKINQRFQDLKLAMMENQKILNELNEKEETIKMEKSQLQTLLTDKKRLFHQFELKISKENEINPPSKPQIILEQRNVNVNHCTFSHTDRNYVEQIWFHCYDCNLTGNLGMCLACALNCHKGHKIKFSGKHNCFCDCGCKENCTCLDSPSNLSIPDENLE